MARPAKLHYAWVVAAITFLTLLGAAGMRATPGVLIVPLESEFGWSRGTISLAVGINIFLYGLIGPFAAAVMERFGLRRTMLAALALIAIGVALTPLMTQPWQLVLLWGVVVGIRQRLDWAGAGRHRGGTLVCGAAGSGDGRTDREHGDRSADLFTCTRESGRASRLADRFADVAAVAVGLIPLVAVLMRDRPSDIGLAPYGAQPGAVAGASSRGNPVATALVVLRDGLRSRDFWLLAGSFFICGASTNGLIGTHLIPACVDHGIPEVQGATLLAAMGIFDFIGTTMSGWLSDRWSNRGLLAWYYGLRGLSLMYLPFAFGMSFYGLPLFAVFYGLDWIATVPPTVRLTAQIFGASRGPVMFGWIAAAHQMGAAIAAFATGALRTALGTYLEAFMAAGLMCLGAALLVLLIGRSGREGLPIPAPAE